MAACKAAMVVAFRDLTPFTFAQIGLVLGVSKQRAQQLDRDGRRHMAADLTGAWVQQRVEAEREVGVWVAVFCT